MSDGPVMSYRPPKPLRMRLEQLDKRLRRERQHDEAIARQERERRSMENSRRIVAAAAATGAVVEDLWDEP